jgi:hypothetical protein
MLRTRARSWSHPKTSILLNLPSITQDKSDNNYVRYRTDSAL